MKKWISLALCMLLLLPSVCGAEDTAHIDIAALMARQVSGNSTLRVRLAAEGSEAAPSFLDAEVWREMRAMISDASLEASYVFSRAASTLGNSQAVLTLRRGENALSTLYASGRDRQWQLWGDALGDTLAVLPRDTSLLLRDWYLTLAGWGGVLLRGLGFELSGLSPENNQWPTLYRFLAQAFTETDAWCEQAEGTLEKYAQQVSSWMQEKTKLYLIKDGSGGVGTQSEIKLSGDTLTDEALTLLRMFYADRTLQSLLRQKMTEAEAQTYLEPGMLLLYEQVLRGMTLPEEMVFSRLTDHNGDLERTSLRMPLADGTVLLWENAGDMNTYGLDKADRSLRVSVETAQTGWQGDFSLRWGDAAYEGAYQLFAALEPVYEDESANGRERRQNGVVTLMITPADERFSAQTVTVEIAAHAGLENDQAAHWDAVLQWQEADTSAGMRVDLQARTGAAIQQAEAVGEPLELAQADAQTRAQLLRSAWTRIRAALTQQEDNP